MLNMLFCDYGTFYLDPIGKKLQIKNQKNKKTNFDLKTTDFFLPLSMMMNP